MTKTIILAGAPDPTSLKWSEDVLLPPATEGKVYKPAVPKDIAESPQLFEARWRELDLTRSLMRPAHPKLDIDTRLTPVLDIPTSAEFFTPTDLFLQPPNSDRDSSNDSYASTQDSEKAASQALSAFYEHSFSIHEAVPSRDLTEISEVTPGTPTYESNEEMFPLTSSSSNGIIRVPSRRRLSQVPRPKHLSNLEDIPSARQLESIQPSTMTVNLIVGVLSISDVKTVTTGARYGRPREAELVEILTGDETKTGFSITMWLPPEMRVNWKDGVNPAPEGSRSVLRRDVKIIRPQDIILLQNVALSSYKGKVHGQSLRKDVTKVILLFRKRVNEVDVEGVYTVGALRQATDSDQQLLKVKRVRNWMMEFVGESKAAGSRRGSRRDVLYPADTQ